MQVMEQRLMALGYQDGIALESIQGEARPIKDRECAARGVRTRVDRIAVPSMLRYCLGLGIPCASRSAS